MTKLSDVGQILDMTALTQRVAREDVGLIREFLAKPTAERKKIREDFRSWFKGFASLRELEWISAREFVIPRYQKYFEDGEAVLAHSNRRYEAMRDLAGQIDNVLAVSEVDEDLLAQLLQKYIDTLNTNFEFEESMFVPVILEHYDPAERKQAEIAYVRRVGLRAIAFELAWILTRASPEERRAILARMPAVARFLYLHVWEPRLLRRLPAFAKQQIDV